jgi:hypothetical protein
METRGVLMAKVFFMDGRMNAKLGCPIMDMPRDGQSASNPALNGSDGSEELDDAGIDKAHSKDVNVDLAEEMDDDTNDETMLRI